MELPVGTRAKLVCSNWAVVLVMVIVGRLVGLLLGRIKTRQAVRNWINLNSNGRFERMGQTFASKHTNRAWFYLLSLSLLLIGEPTLVSISWLSISRHLTMALLKCNETRRELSFRLGKFKSCSCCMFIHSAHLTENSSIFQNNQLHRHHDQAPSDRFHSHVHFWLWRCCGGGGGAVLMLDEGQV